MHAIELVEALDEDETGQVAMGGIVPTLVDEADEPTDDDLTALNLQVDFVAAAPAAEPEVSAPVGAPAMRPRLHTLPLADAELQMQYAPTQRSDFPASVPVQSTAVPQPPPSVPSLSSLEVPNVETRRIDAETLAEVLARNTSRASWKTPLPPPMQAVAKKPVSWERRIGITLLVLAAAMVTLAVARPDLIAKSVTWASALMKNA